MRVRGLAVSADIFAPHHYYGSYWAQFTGKHMCHIPKEFFFICTIVEASLPGWLNTNDDDGNFPVPKSMQSTLGVIARLIGPH